MKQKNKQQPQTIYNNQQELPMLYLCKTVTVGDSNFVKERIELQSRGWTLQESALGIEYLLKELKKLSKSK